MEKLEDKKKKRHLQRGGEEAVEGGSHASTPAAAQGKGKRQLGLASGTVSYHERGRVHIWDSSFLGQRGSTKPPCPQARSAAPGQRNEQADDRRGSGTAGQTKAEIGGRNSVASGRSRPVEAALTGGRSGDPRAAGAPPAPTGCHVRGQGWSEAPARCWSRVPPPCLPP